MNPLSGAFRLAVIASLVGFAKFSAAAPPIPAPLQPWQDWATWDAPHRNCPTPYSDPNAHRCFWPSQLALQAGAAGGAFQLGVEAYAETWVPLPGGGDAWPVDVRIDGNVAPVVEHEGRPAVRLPAGAHAITGAFRWAAIPQSLPVPAAIGVLALTLDGRPVEFPAWDANGVLWLKRAAAPGTADKDFLAVKAYAVIDDGIPLWLRTEIELVVSGKSREEAIGAVLPAGWKLAAVRSPIPVAVDDAGRLKAQVRAGKWTVQLDAFRLDDPKEFAFAPDAKPAVADELVAFRARPDFRFVDIVGSPSVDVSQTTFPERWRRLPVYRWDTATPFRLEERMRGMGRQKPAGLAISRELWLDEAGSGLTFRDRIDAQRQQIWRLDAAPGQDIGSVQIGGEGQLITRNPANGAPGVEIRTRDISLEATGRMERAARLPATGWRSDADSLRITLNLPPGWRLFALFGADWVNGDWLTAWTLLDLFLLLIFSLAVGRLWGVGPAIVAFLAFGLSFHEPGAPRYAWLLLLIPLALLRVVPEGWGRRLVRAGKWLMVVVLLLALAPFVSRQVQQAIYPQLEVVGSSGAALLGQAAGEAMAAPQTAAADGFANEAAVDQVRTRSKPGIGNYGVLSKAAPSPNSNMAWDVKARIQTGPAIPDWQWRVATFGWSGPVAESQTVRPILIPRGVEQALTALRVALLLLLAAILLDARRMRGCVFRGAKAAALMAAALAFAAPVATAQDFPDRPMLDQLRERLLKPADAYPTAADIPHVALSLDGRRLAMDAEIHVALEVAVPLPGRLPAWSPVSVDVDGKPAAALRRDDGYLWVVLAPGVHRVRVEGVISDASEWEWTFRLRPRRVAIDAPGWTVGGVRADGVPEAQVFFARQQRSAAEESSYERQNLQTLVAVDRRLEIGLVWQVHTVVTRLSEENKAVALRVPLLPGENVLSANAVVRDGFIEVRLGANEKEFRWESELSTTGELTLATRAADTWVERWRLVASPVWNVALSGLAPIFEANTPSLVPVWHPWPGESVALKITRPEAIAGATITINRGAHDVSVGKRQRTAKLDLALRCSLGEDFLLGLPAEAEVTALTHDGAPIPVRRDGTKLVVPLRPGEQRLSVAWTTDGPLGLRAGVDPVRLPVESANVQTTIRLPGDRWVLWTDGPLRGPAVRFWIVLACSLLAAIVLGRINHSPLRPLEWMLLAIGLTQVPLPAALTVIGWLFLLAWRGRESFQRLRPIGYNFVQIALVGVTAIALGIFVAVVAQGLLGSPRMFILGNGSGAHALSWFQARCGPDFPQPGAVTISIWWYRLAMLAWALWLAASLLRWLAWGWRQFSAGGFFRGRTPKASPPPAA